MNLRGPTFALLLLTAAACRTPALPDGAPPPFEGSGLSPAQSSLLKKAMLEEQIIRRGVKDPRVLRALETVPRHEFVPREHQTRAYGDYPLPIGEEQTISQPYIVALMSELAGVGPGSKVFEVGTGSGYQTAVLAEMGAEVYSVEIVPKLAERAARTLERLGYAGKVRTKQGDGYAGWPEAAPFDAIILTAAPPKIPEPLLLQLKVGGRLVAPVGGEYQELKTVTRTDTNVWEEKPVIPVRFVPMTGEAQKGK